MKRNFTCFAIVMVMATNIFALNTNYEKKIRPATADELISQRIFSKRSEQLKSSYQQKVLNYWEGNYDVRHNAKKVIKHEWDNTRNDWFMANRESFVYDDFGRPVEIITEYNLDGTFIPSTRINYSWRENNEPEEVLISFWCSDGNKWIPELKEVYEYDKFGNLVYETHSQWSESDNSWKPYFIYRVDFTYTESGSPITEEAFYWSQFAGDLWLPSHRVEYEYYKNGNVYAEIFSIPSGMNFEYSYREDYFYNEYSEISSTMIYHYDSKDWVPHYKITDIEWYNFHLRQMKSCIFRTPDNWDDWTKTEEIEWHQQFRLSYEYHPKLHSETLYLEEFYFDCEETWYPLYRERTIYNEYLFKTGYYEEVFWDDWSLESAIVSDGEFNSSGQPVDIQIRAFDSWNGNMWQNVARMIFEYETITNAPVYNAPTTEIAKVFPNPAVNQINVAPQCMSSDLQVKIYGITGQLLRSQSIQAFSGQTSIEISGIPSGIYIMDIISGNEKQVVKFMKR